MSRSYTRFFRVTSGPLIQALRDRISEMQAGWDAWLRLAEELGAETVMRYDNGRVAGFTFEPGKAPDLKLWKRLDNGCWWPKRNSKAAKDLYDRVAKTQRPVSEQEALKVIGLHTSPVVIEGNRAKLCAVYGYPEEGRLYVQVPWRDVPAAELDAYRANREAKTHYSMELDHLLWSPTEDMVEIKEWECLRETESLREAERKAA